mgnify:CR=1 FL=1
MILGFHHLKPRRNLRRLPQHDARRAIFFMAHGDRTFYRRCGYAFASHGELHVDARKHFGIYLSAFAGEFDAAERLDG